VKIAGMDPFKPVPPEDVPRSYGAKPKWQRALVIAAGPGTHFLVAVVLFALAFMFVGDASTTKPIVADVVPTLHGETAPAAAAGLEPGDQIVAVGDVRDPTRDQLGTYTTSHIGMPIPYTILRDGHLVHSTMTPVSWRLDGSVIGRIGIVLGPEKLGVPGALTRGVGAVGAAAKDTVTQIGRVFGPEGIGRIVKVLFTSAPREASDPTSVVGIGRAVGEAARQSGLGVLLFTLAFVTVFVGLLNLVPLPPFDGGHLAVLVIEKVRGRSIDMRRLIPVSAVVISFLVLFVGMTVLLDLTKPLPLGP
jgi:membrane-associated protease RseP (regulator of RpoE activity)